MSQFLLPLATKLFSNKLYFREYKDSSLVDTTRYHWRVISNPGISVIYNLPSTMIVTTYLTSATVRLQYVITVDDVSSLYKTPPTFRVYIKKQLMRAAVSNIKIGYKLSVDLPGTIIDDYEEIASGTLSFTSDESVLIKGPDRLIEGDSPEDIEADNNLKESIKELIYEIELSGDNFGAAIQATEVYPGNYITDFSIDGLFKP